MSDHYDPAEPAFPTGGVHTYRDGTLESVSFHGGMTLRDYFAGQASIALIPAMLPILSYKPDNLAHDAYLLADAMLAERAK